MKSDPTVQAAVDAYFAELDLPGLADVDLLFRVEAARLVATRLDAELTRRKYAAVPAGHVVPCDAADNRGNLWSVEITRCTLEDGTPDWIISLPNCPALVKWTLFEWEQYADWDNCMIDRGTNWFIANRREVLTAIRREATRLEREAAVRDEKEALNRMKAAAEAMASRKEIAVERSKQRTLNAIQAVQAQEWSKR